MPFFDTLSSVKLNVFVAITCNDYLELVKNTANRALQAVILLKNIKKSMNQVAK